MIKNKRKRNFFSKNHKGLSTIVVTLIMILLGLVAVGIVWVVVNNILKTGAQQTTTGVGQLFISLKLQKVQVLPSGDLTIIVKRNVGAGDLQAVYFVISDGTNTKGIQKDATLQELGSQSFTILSSEVSGLSIIKEVSVAPVLKTDSGKGSVGNVVDTYEVGSEALASPNSQSSPGTSCKNILDSGLSTGDGVYWINGGSSTAFQVYCDMTTDGGGWTLVDNDATNSETFTSRQAGANSNIAVTRGSYLPAYSWSSNPQLLCKGSYYTGTLGWITLNATGSHAREYPTTTTTTTEYDNEWAIGNLNGNTNRGTGAWIYNGQDRFGSVWIGNGGWPTCACDYYAVIPQGGLGDNTVSSSATCSTWVR